MFLTSNTIIDRLGQGDGAPNHLDLVLDEQLRQEAGNRARYDNLDRVVVAPQWI